MSDNANSSRVARPEMLAKARALADGTIVLTSPSVGLWRDAPEPGAVVVPGQSLGELETLGVMTLLRAPATAKGLILEALGASVGKARRAVQHGDVLLVLDPANTARVVASTGENAAAATTRGGLVFRTPSSGRYYDKPGPGKEPFVKVGDVISFGHSVALLEVMKTFNRLQYGGEGLPERACVTAIIPAHESDLAPGDVLLELEPA